MYTFITYDIHILYILYHIIVCLHKLLKLLKHDFELFSGDVGSMPWLNDLVGMSDEVAVLRQKVHKVNMFRQHANFSKWYCYFEAILKLYKYYRFFRKSTLELDYDYYLLQSYYMNVKKVCCTGWRAERYELRSDHPVYFAYTQYIAITWGCFTIHNPKDRTTISASQACMIASPES